MSFAIAVRRLREQPTYHAKREVPKTGRRLESGLVIKFRTHETP